MNKMVEPLSKKKRNSGPQPSLASIQKESGNSIRPTGKKHKAKKHSASKKLNKKMLNAKEKEEVHNVTPIGFLSPATISVNFTQVDNAGPFRQVNKVPQRADSGVSRPNEFVVLKEPFHNGVLASDVKKNNKFTIIYPSPRYGRLTGKRKHSNSSTQEKMNIDPDSENSEISIHNHKQRKVIEPVIHTRSISSLINAQYDSD